MYQYVMSFQNGQNPIFLPKVLQWAKVKIDDHKCHQTYQSGFREDSMICAGEKVLCSILPTCVTSIASTSRL